MISKEIRSENLHYMRRQLKKESDTIAIDVLTHAIKQAEAQLELMA